MAGLKFAAFSALITGGVNVLFYTVGSFILLAAVENQAVGFNSSETLKNIKEERQAILFGPLSENKMFEVSGRVKSDSAFDSSMAYRFDGSTYSKIKLFK